MENNKLKILVEKGLSQREMAEELDCSQGNVRHWLKKHGLKTNRSQEKRGFPCCCICGDTEQNNFYKSCHGSWCKDCHNKICISKQRQRKKEAVDYKGGACEICGYDKCLGSLDFHHRDPSKKDPGWTTMKSRPLENIKSELDKCMLVCRNCHGEIHDGLVTI